MDMLREYELVNNDGTIHTEISLVDSQKARLHDHLKYFVYEQQRGLPAA